MNTASIAGLTESAGQAALLCRPPQQSADAISRLLHAIGQATKEHVHAQRICRCTPVRAEAAELMNMRGMLARSSKSWLPNSTSKRTCGSLL